MKYCVDLDEYDKDYVFMGKKDIELAGEKK